MWSSKRNAAVVVMILIAGCAADDDDHDDTSRCKCSGRTELIALGNYERRPDAPGLPVEAQQNRCLADGICPDTATIDADTVTMRFVKDGKTYEAVFDITGREVK